MNPIGRLCCLVVCLAVCLGLLPASPAQAWPLKAPGLSDKLWLFNVLSSKQEDPAWKQCGDLVYEAEYALEKKDYEIALKFLRDYEAASCTREWEDIKVWRYIGVLNMEGYGTPKNIDEAVKYLTKSAEKKDTESQFGLGLLLIVERSDVQNGLFWLEQAVEEGHVTACYTVGHIYHMENTPLYSLEKAIQYYELGAKRNNIDCSYELGLLYYYGEGVQENLDKSLELLTFAAERGHADAAHSLSGMLMEAYEHDAELLEEAYLWLETSKYFAPELDTNCELEQSILKELSPKSKAKVDKKLERFVSRIILRTQK